MVTLDEIKKLPPRERIEKLKELEKEKKEEIENARKIEQEKQKEVEEAKKLIEESAFEAEEEIKDLLKDAYDEQELSQIVTPPGNDLETQISQTKIAEQQVQDAQSSYINSLSMRPAYELYQEAQGYPSDGLNSNQIRELSNIQYALEEKKKAIETGEYSTTEKIVSQIDTASKIIDDIMGAYKL